MCIYFIAALVLLLVARYSFTKIASFDYKRLRSWSKEVWPWLCRGKDVFGGAFVIVASVVICWRFGWNSKAFTVSGCVLELAGLAQTIRSLLGMREYFNHPRLADLCKKWIKERPRLKRSSGAVSVQGSVSAGLTVSASAVVFPGEIDTNKPIDEIIKRIAANNKIISDLFEKNLFDHISFDQNIRGLRADIKSNVDATKAENKKELEHLHLGDFTPTLVGFAWIAAGTIMGAIGSWLS
uniref:hypothetical protein n=1 Tax=Candidatus Electronema sp. TaxID=2698783 RepID=UPI00405740BE